MMKVNLFFCDIRGTFDGNDQERQEEIRKLVNNLHGIMDVDNLDNLYFSFISSDHMEDVREFVNELEPYLVNSRIKLGPQFSNKHVLINGERKRCESGKVNQMIKYLDGMEVNNIYYADDAPFYHKMFLKLFELKFPNANIQSFILGHLEMSDKVLGLEEVEISGLNKILSTYINARKEYDASVMNKENRTK